MDYNFYIAALGASAGGLKALKSYFSNVKDVENIAYVVVLHSKRDYESHLPQILARHTSTPIVEIEQGMAIERGKIFIHPPAMKVTLKEGHFILSERSSLELLNRTINHFLNSLAEDAKDKVIGVIMSGTGNDGTEGFHAIEKNRGITLVQDPETAEFDGMPNHSIKYDHPTFILPPDKMPKEIENYVRQNLQLEEHITHINI
ncbi:chemotaxis protein CheB [Chryseosolibacter indicus]|uniref:protein-glutamate methylesterase n=1 Tax=Chryseosolibacter indicus TaxID=2782351 RepID=A0ABS5VSB2_9BACT|nr:chemotaxis protein CheB [Chryseosolibacter indicus]MBT1703730.1 chemotaxis protein CheB [Chryseosolibacter indicus]